MTDYLITSISEYWDFYYRYLLSQWRHMTPMKFTALLIAIAAIGWFLMRNSAKSV